MDTASQLKALLKKAQDEEAAAHVELTNTLEQMEDAKEKLAAAQAEAAKEHADAQEREKQAADSESTAHANEMAAKVCIYLRILYMVTLYSTYSI